jgi:hypothetical protein
MALEPRWTSIVDGWPVAVVKLLLWTVKGVRGVGNLSLFEELSTKTTQPPCGH